MKNELQKVWFRNYLTDSELYGKGPWLDRGPSETSSDLQPKITSECGKLLSHNVQYFSEKVPKV